MDLGHVGRPGVGVHDEPGAFGFRKRMAIATAGALFAWLSVLVLYWSWYRFPTSFTVVALVEQVLGWLLAGVAMARRLGGRSARRRTKPAWVPRCVAAIANERR